MNEEINEIYKKLRAIYLEANPAIQDAVFEVMSDIVKLKEIKK